MEAVLGIDPKISQDDSAARELISYFQERGILGDLTLVSVIFPALFPVPMKWFKEEMRHYQKDIHRNVLASYEADFRFEDAKVITSFSSRNEDVVKKFIHYALKRNFDYIVLFGQSQHSLPEWLLGSFAEVATLTAPRPVLVFKSQLTPKGLSPRVRIVVAIDVETRIPGKSLNWLMEFLKNAKSEVFLVYVRSLTVEDAKEKLEVYQAKFERRGIRASVHVIGAKTSVAKELVDFTEKKKAWMTVTFSSKRSRFYKFLLGSSSKKLLALTKRPFLNVQLAE